VVEESAGLADDDSKLGLDGLKMGVDPPAAGSLQGAEQPIAPRMISLTFGHAVSAVRLGLGLVALLRE
jgi:hypothetical protein